MLTINLPRFGEVGCDKHDFLMLYGWTFELWGCSIDPDWLAKYLDVFAYRQDPVPQTFPLMVPYGWEIERNTYEFTRHGGRSSIDFWVVDEQGRRRIAVEAYRHPLVSGPIVARGLRLRSRFEIVGEEYFRNAEFPESVVMAMLIEGDVTTVERRICQPAPIEDNDHMPWRERENIERDMRKNLLQQAIQELNHRADCLTPFWKDPVTSWFHPDENPFLNQEKYLTTTSALLHRWLKLLPDRAIGAYVMRSQFPLKGPSLFERVEEQRRLLGRSIGK